MNITTAQQLCLVEDDASIADALISHFEGHGFVVDHFADGAQGLKALQSKTYDAAMLDVMLPHVNGLDICKSLRSQSIQTPILMLTALDTEADRVIGLELGADDYLPKPFGLRECLARVKALIRRASVNHAEPEVSERLLEFGEVQMNPATRTAMVEHQVLDLTAKEFDLLLYLARHPDVVFSRSQLLDAVWGYGYEGYEHTVNTHINRLRNKLHQFTAVEIIHTVWGVGYKFIVPELSHA